MIYFLAPPDRSRIKIGTTVRLSARLQQLIYEYGKLETLGIIDGSYAEERALHERFASTRIEGEWFEPSDELHDLICAEARPWQSSDDKPMEFSKTIRLDRDAAATARMAARLMGMTTPEYISMIVSEQAAIDVRREAAKLLLPEPEEMAEIDA